VLCLTQLAHVLAIRSERHSLVTQGMWSNTPLLGAVVLTLALQLATIYVPVLRPVFKTEPLGPAELAWALAAAGVVFVAVEIEKWTMRRRDRRAVAGIKP
jgi:Ca2+-transporting ATPase